MLHQSSPETHSHDEVSNRQLSEQRSSEPTSHAADGAEYHEEDLLSRIKKSLVQSQKDLASQQLDCIERVTTDMGLLLQKLKFLKLSGKSVDSKIELICLYNLSTGYQKLAFSKNSQASLQQCINYLCQAIDLNQGLINSEDEKAHFFKLHFIQVKISLQYCALLSQVERHEDALQVSSYALGLLKKIFNNGYRECSQALLQIQHKNQDLVFFTKNVLTKALEYLEELSQMEEYSELMEPKGMDLLKIKEKVYFWKQNFENNEKFFRKQIEAKDEKGKKSSARSILGIKISNEWIQDFSIGMIMHMKPLNYVELQEKDNIVFEFSYRSLIEKVLLTSVSYFSIATEMRFMEDKLKKGQESKGLKSEIFHIKAIEISCKHIKQSSILIEHLVNSYHKHYNNKLIAIQEESSSAEYSLMEDRSKKSPLGNQLLSILNDFEKVEGLRKVNQGEQRDKNSLLLFKKKKKKKTIDFLSEEKSHPIKSEQGGEIWYKERTLRKMQYQKKIEKSGCNSNITVFKDEKKSFSSVGKGSKTVRMMKSPEPSVSSQKSRSIREIKKNNRVTLTQRKR